LANSVNSSIDRINVFFYIGEVQPPLVVLYKLGKQFVTTTTGRDITTERFEFIYPLKEEMTILLGTYFAYQIIEGVNELTEPSAGRT
jgi:hypothetical protein